MVIQNGLCRKYFSGLRATLFLDIIMLRATQRLGHLPMGHGHRQAAVLLCNQGGIDAGRASKNLLGTTHGVSASAPSAPLPFVSVFQSVVLRVVQKHTRDDIACIGRSAKHFRNSLGHFAMPARPDKEVKARCCAIHLAKLSKAIRSGINHLINPKSVTKIWHLDNNRRFIQNNQLSAINDS